MSLPATNQTVTAAKEPIKLQMEGGGSLTQAALEATIAAYEALYNNAPPNLSGNLADKNLANFRAEFSRLRAENFVYTDQTIGDLAVRNISFGRSRIKVGYGNLTTSMSKFDPMGVPASVSVEGKPSR